MNAIYPEEDQNRKTMKKTLEEYNLDRIKINISGTVFETHKKTLQRFPDTLLGNEKYCTPYFCPKTNQYFFNRNKNAFEAILYFYQSSGDLRVPINTQMDLFLQECQFYGIPKPYVDSMKFKAGMSSTIDGDDTTIDKKVDIFCTDFQKKVWDLLENPESSECARYLAFIFVILIFLSVALACVETLPIVATHQPFWKNPIAITELSFNVCFLAQLFLRFIFCPAKLKFLKSFLNFIDIIGVVPYFIVFSVNQDKMTSLSFLRILRCFRILRLFRLSKHSSRINTVGIILKDSIKDLYVFAVCLFIMTVFSGAILYYLEKDIIGTKFTSIPISMWWALQTVVTIGYGDIVPISVIGKLYSAFFMVFGALTISLPVLSIVMKFTMMYSLQR